jgi:hypothetical protein
MQENIIYKLKTLQSIEPERAWQADRKRKLMEKVSVFGVKNDILLSANDIYAKKPAFDARSFMPNRFAVSFASILMILTGGVFTVGASQSSLPGDTLYSVKKVGEQMALAVASDQDRPKIEIEQAGKRLEELAQISQKASDSDQHQKVAQLVSDFQEKVSSANEHLSQLSEKGGTSEGAQLASVARVVNEQSEKYTDVLQKTTDGLPQTVKEKVADQVADATKTTEQTNLSALMVMVDNPQDQDSGDIAAKVQKTLDKAEVKVNELAATQTPAAQMATTGDDSKGSICSGSATDSSVKGGASAKDINTENVAITEEAKKELEKAKENLKSNNLADTLKNVAAVGEITDKVVTPDTSGLVAPTTTDPTLPKAADIPSKR